MLFPRLIHRTSASLKHSFERQIKRASKDVCRTGSFALEHNHMKCHSISSFAKRKMRHNLSPPLVDADAIQEAPAKVPFLKETLRKLYLRIHPDLLQRYPREAKHNDENFQKLMEFLSSLKDGVGNPKRQRLQLQFYLRTSRDGEFERGEVNIRTSGGRCHNLVAEALGEFFKSVGLPERFEWGTDYWQMDVVERAPQDWDEEEQEEIRRHEHRIAVNLRDFPRAASLRGEFLRSKEDYMAGVTRDIQAAAAATGLKPLRPTALYSGTSEGHYDFSGTWAKEFLGREDEEMQKLDGLAQAIAFVPYADASQAAEVDAVLNEVIPTMESRGWPIRGVAERIWAGDRNEELLYGWMDARSYPLMQRVMLHTLALERLRN